MKRITAEQYKAALIKSGILDSEIYRSILNAQYAAPSGKITANQLAKLLGISHWGTINLRYGEMGHKLSDALEVRPPKGKDGKYWWWNIISDGQQTEYGFIWTLWSNIAQALEEVGVAEMIEAPLVEGIDILFSEGAKTKLSINKYERNAVARRRCINFYGPVCSVCGFDFKKIYGPIGEGFIHVHHLVEVSSIGKEYKLNPIEDLRPVCPNCHAMLHRRNPAYSIEELKVIITQQVAAGDAK